MGFLNTIADAFRTSIPGNVVTTMVMQDAAADDFARLRRIAERWDAYYGKMKKPLAVKPGASDDNIILNFAKVIISEGAGMLFGKPLDFVVDGSSDGQGEDDDDSGEDDGAKANPLDDWLEQCWAANKGMTTLNKIAISGGVTGHVFVKLIPAGTEQNETEFPRVVILDTAGVSATWDPCDVERVLAYTLSWHAVDRVTQRPCAYRQTITRAPGGQTWEIVDQQQPDGSSAWTTTDRLTWNFPWAPIFQCQNLPAPNQFYGVSDIEDDVLEANGGMNLVVSNIARILRFHAHPKTWGTGFVAERLNIDVDGIIKLPKDGTLQNLEMSSDLSSSIAFYQELKKALHAISRTPDIATGELENLPQQISGIALKVLYGPLLRQNGSKQLLYGDMLCDLSQRMIELAGKGAGKKVSVTWPDPLPSDPVQDREALTMDEQLGVSKETCLEKLGYNAKQEQARKGREQQDLGSALLTSFDRGQTGGQPVREYMGVPKAGAPSGQGAQK